MLSLVSSDSDYNRGSYKKLLSLLHSIEYKPYFELDNNRLIDGIYLRYRFGHEIGYSYHDMDNDESVFMSKPCSVLEMMVALAYRVEEQIMDNNSYGNRMSVWFWSMIVSLGLGKMYDDVFDKDLCIDIVQRFMSHAYSPDGKGGLFTLANPQFDMRDADIWCQCMWYLNEV
jgi:hypothetical protein